VRDVIHDFKNATELVTTHSTFAPVLSPGSPLLTLNQVAERLGVSREWVRDHATRRAPRIPVVRLGGRRALLRFRPQDVETFITSNLFSGEKAAQ
jgi:predicted DNA-binding transcriptional regulator AlpA